MKRVGVGIDFGTTNSAAAAFDGHDLTLVPLETGTVGALGSEHDGGDHAVSHVHRPWPANLHRA